VLEVFLCVGTSKHGDGTDTTVQTGALLDTDCRTRHLEVAVTESDVIQALDDCIDDFVISILAECDTLN
jgi:hypothetical protein